MGAARETTRAWSAALLIALAFLCHDLLMAEAGASASAATKHTALVHGEDRAQFGTVPSMDKQPHVRQPPGCSVARPIDVLPGDQLDRCDASATTRLATIPSPTGPHGRTWLGLGAPSATRRALFQVWRI